MTTATLNFSPDARRARVVIDAAYSAVRDLQTVGTWHSDEARRIVQDAVDYGDRLVELTRALVEIHRPTVVGHVCCECAKTWPCPTIAALALA